MSRGAQHHNGVRLGVSPTDRLMYSVRHDGRDFWWRGDSLPREWLRVYVRWHCARGEKASAARLLRSWLAAGGDRWDMDRCAQQSAAAVRS